MTKRPKISLCTCVWNTEHLMRRSIQTWAKQDFPKDDWELIVIDDNSMGDVKSIIEPYKDLINIQYVRFEHSFGMRGCAIAYNTAFMIARGDIIAETTPETMWQPNVLKKLYELHEGELRTFVAMKTYNLNTAAQVDIDLFDWQNDIMNLTRHKDWKSPWTQQNAEKTEFRTHQTCSIRKDTFFEITKGRGFPLFCGYGEEDPWYSHVRETSDVKDVVVMDVMPIHQWHLPFQYFSSLGYAPNLNRHSHTMANYMNDVGGEVPEGGTRYIFDHGDDALLSDDEKRDWRGWDRWFLETGGNPKVIDEAPAGQAVFI